MELFQLEQEVPAPSALTGDVLRTAAIPAGEMERPLAGHQSEAEELLGLDDRIPLIRQSTINTWMKCRRKFLFEHRFGLQPKGASGPGALEVGTFFHLCAAHRRLGHPPDVAVREAGEIIAKRIEEADKEGRLDTSKLSREFEQALALARVMEECYFEMFPPDPSREPVAVELKVRAKQRGIPTELQITVDLVSYDRANNEIWIEDYKTTSFDPLIRAGTMTFEPQTRLYRIVLTSLLRGGLLSEKGVPSDARVAGFVHSVVKKPALRLRIKDSYTDYLQRVRDWYRAEGEFSLEKASRTNEPVILQSHIRFEDSLNDEELHSVLYEANRACRADTKLRSYPRNWQACYDYNRPCPFLTLCTTDTRAWNAIVTTQYQQREEEE